MQIEISIIVPFYKNLKLLKRALNSIFLQNFKNYEVILVYDNFNKNDLFHLKKIISEKKNIKLICNKKNIGAGLSRNKGIKFAKGKYICFLDSDDVWKKNKLSVQLNFMKKKNWKVSHTSYDIINLKNKLIGKRNASNLSYNNLLNSCDIGLSTVMIRKDIFKPKILFPKLKTKEDFVLWLKIAKKGFVFYGINQSLTKWTDRPDSLSKSTFQKLKDGYAVYNKFEGFNFISSIYRLFILSLNFLNKK